MKEYIYLDHAASTPVDPLVAEVMRPWGTQSTANASSTHAMGRKSRRAIDGARRTIAEHLHCSPHEIIFTSGGTESMNIAFQGIARLHRRGNIVTTTIEHAAVLQTLRYLESEEHIEIRHVPVNNHGVVDAATVAEHVDAETLLVSVMLANNEIGTIEPIAEIVAAVKEKNPAVLVHSDACQAGWALPIDVQTIGVDLLSLSANKMYGPSGCGMLYKQSDVRLTPLMFGGPQEYGLRPGSENIAGIVGFAKAIELAVARRDADTRYTRTLRDIFFTELHTAMPLIRWNGDPENNLPFISNILFPGIDCDALLLYLEEEGIMASRGAACASGATAASHVLTAIGLSKKDAQSSVRFSFGRTNTDNERQKAVDAIIKSIHTLSSRL